MTLPNFGAQQIHLVLWSIRRTESMPVPIAVIHWYHLKDGNGSTTGTLGFAETRVDSQT